MLGATVWRMLQSLSCTHHCTGVLAHSGERRQLISTATAAGGTAGGIQGCFFPNLASAAVLVQDGNRAEKLACRKDQGEGWGGKKWNKIRKTC